MFLEIHEKDCATYLNLEEIKYIRRECDGCTAIYWRGEPEGERFEIAYDKVRQVIKRALIAIP